MNLRFLFAALVLVVVVGVMTWPDDQTSEPADEQAEKAASPVPSTASSVSPVPPPADELGGIWSVLGLDAREVGAFTAVDAAGLERVLRAGGL